jgi:hypothetical protein
MSDAMAAIALGVGILVLCMVLVLLLASSVLLVVLENMGLLAIASRKRVFVTVRDEPVLLRNKQKI